MGKIINYGQDAQEKIIKGIEKTAKAIKTTLGPAGHCVAIEGIMGMSPEITRDGATVAKSIKFSDGSENIGAELVKKAATLTEEEAGDGTSTTSILINELVKTGQKYIKTGININSLKSGMLKAGAKVSEFLKENTIPVGDDLEKIGKVATISANNDPEVGNLIKDCFAKVGTDGVITADLSSGLETVIDVTQGMKIERGWASPTYADVETGTCTMENPYIAVIGERISSVNQIMPVLDKIIPLGRPILFIVDEMDEIVDKTLTINVLRGALKACVIKGVDFGDNRKNTMDDIACLTGGTYICPENGKTAVNITEEDLGSAAKVIISRDSTLIFNGAGDAEEIKKRVELLKTRKKDAISKYDLAKWDKRIANLSGGIGIIKAGGATEAEKVNRKQTIEDAILAAKCAMSEGCSAGGGWSYVKAEQSIRKDSKFWKELKDDEIYGAEIVLSAISVIMKTVVSNAGVSGDVVYSEVSKNSKKEYYGFNAKTREYCNLVESGILDSTKSLRISLENAISTASMVLLIDCSLLEENDSDKELQ